MRRGTHLGRAGAVAACVLLGSLAALLVSYKVSLLPPRLQARSLEMATAKTTMVVDGPVSTVLDLRLGAGDIDGLTSRAVLIGNVMLSEPVLGYIGRRAGVPPEAIRVRAPLTPDFPRPLAGSAQDPKTSDLLRSTDQYRLSIETNPAVPIVTAYAQAPTAAAAAALANASVDGLRAYLAAVSATRARPHDRVTVTQLGRATGAVINGGVRVQLAVLVFVAVLALSAGGAALLRRVRLGWVAAGAAADARPADPGVAAAARGGSPAGGGPLLGDGPRPQPH